MWEVEVVVLCYLLVEFFDYSFQQGRFIFVLVFVGLSVEVYVGEVDGLEGFFVGEEQEEYYYGVLFRRFFRFGVFYLCGLYYWVDGGVFF